MKNRLSALEQFALTTLVTLGLLLVACHSKPQSEPPTAEEQKKIEQEHQKTMEQQKQLTSGYDKSMRSTPPSTGYVPTKQNTGKQKTQQQQQQPQPQPQQKH